jgi:hypothetical protein
MNNTLNTETITITITNTGTKKFQMKTILIV